MKNILITTTFEADTLQSLKIATEVIGNSASEICLLSTSEISDSITDLLFLSPKDHIDTRKRSELLDAWKNLKGTRGSKFKLHEHHQYGMSRPILEQILSRYKVDLVIVPTSFQQSKQHIHHFLLKLLHKTSCPLMFVPQTRQPDAIKRALYLNEPGRALTSAIENLPFHIIHQSMLEDATKYSIEELIEKLKIDLLVKGKRNGEPRYNDEVEMSELNVPVLTV
jgi:hypothetical protein